MRLTDQAVSVLKALAHTHADDGEFVSREALGRATPGYGPEEVDRALTALEQDNLATRDGEGGAAITEAGLAAMNSLA